MELTSKVFICLTYFRLCREVSGLGKSSRVLLNHSGLLRLVNRTAKRNVSLALRC